MGNRSGRDKRRRSRSAKKRRQNKAPQEPEPAVEHPRYGRIPLVPVSTTLPDGTVHTSLECDPNYLPELPAGAVRGNIRRQILCCQSPRYYFEDIARTCIQCEQEFAFTAREQKYWYETLQFYYYSTAIRCAKCRKQRRSDKALARALQDALSAVAERPGDAAAKLQVTEATVAHFDRLGGGDLDRAIAAARSAYKLRPELQEALYWEGRCHDLAGRRAKGRRAMRQFLEAAEPRGRLRRLVKAAKRRLAPSRER